MLDRLHLPQSQLRLIIRPAFANVTTADEPRRSVRATKGQHTKSLDILDQPAEPPKKSTKKGTAAKKAQSQEVTSPAGDSSNDVIRCVCGATEQDDESTEMWICCETCEAWQHNVCVGMPDEVAEDVKYWCEKCRPENHKPLLENPDLWRQRQHEREVRDAVARKSKKAGKKGKAKRVSDAKSVTSQATNGKAASPAISEAGSTKKDKKETTSRATSMKRKVRDSSQDKEVNKVRMPPWIAMPMSYERLLTFEGSSVQDAKGHSSCTDTREEAASSYTCRSFSQLRRS